MTNYNVQLVNEISGVFRQEKEIVTLANKIRQAARNATTSDDNIRHLLKALQTGYKASICRPVHDQTGETDKSQPSSA